MVVHYTDDISIYATGKNIHDLTKKLNDYAKPKDTKEYNIHPDVQLRGKPVSLEHEPKLLGVTFNTMHTFTPHVNKAKAKVNLIKAVAGSTWVQDRKLSHSLIKP